MWKSECGMIKNVEVGMRNAEWKRIGKWETGRIEERKKLSGNTLFANLP